MQKVIIFFVVVLTGAWLVFDVTGLVLWIYKRRLEKRLEEKKREAREQFKTALKLRGFLPNDDPENPA